MRRFSSLLLVSALAFAMIPFLLLSVKADLITVYEPQTNVALNKPYTASKAYTTVPAGMPYQNVDGKELTDGEKYTNDLYGTCWHGFDHRIESPMYATVDLGSVTEGIIQFRMEMVNQPNSGIDAPMSLTFEVSEDGINYTEVGKGKASSSKLVSDFVLTLKNPVKARYVKANIGKPLSGVFVFCSEFEVYNSKAVQKEESEVSEETEEPIVEEKVGIIETKPLDTQKNKLEFNKGSRFELKNGLLLGARADDTPSSILRELKNVAGIRINDENGKEAVVGNVHTGWSIAQYKDKRIETEYKIAVMGDIKSEMIINDLLGKMALKGEYLAAADTDKNGSITKGDYIRNKLIALDKYELEVKDSKPLEWDMKFKKMSASLYKMTAKAADGKDLSITFDLKSWGMWNIGAFSVGGVTLAGGGTDWEYVYRAAPASTGGWVWSGGNHGNEQLLEIKFYDGISGNELNLKETGSEAAIKNLYIIEKSRLHWGDAGNYYCNVIRKYNIIGQKITLEVDYDFVKDCYFEKSYTCMFPVPKTVGLYMDFLNDDGTQSKVATLKVGAADYSGAFYGKLAACASRYYGDRYPEYSFLVQIFTKNDSVENFKDVNKLMYWDMNTVENKVYYTKFVDGKRSKAAAGTHWNTISSWELEINK